MVLLVPQAQAALSAAAAPIANFGNQRLAQVSGDGWHGQFAVGLLLGVVWAPCVGPTLGVAIAAASQGENLASSFLIFHTHPSGDPSPSAEDLAFTRRMADAGELLGVRMVDHLILGSGGRWVSLRRRRAW